MDTGIRISDVVVSLAGRDKGGLFFVIETADDYVHLADGKVRRLEQPKRKKQKHVRKITRPVSRIIQKLECGEKVLNSELRRELAALGQQLGSQNQGGS